MAYPSIRGWKLGTILGSVLLLAACGGSNSASQDNAGGESRAVNAPPPAFALCASCHSMQPGRNSSGPSLAGLMGRKAGSAPQYPYSPALKASNIVWDEATLDRWMQEPMKMVPGTRMFIAPVKDPAKRQELIQYFKETSAPAEVVATSAPL